MNNYINVRIQTTNNSKTVNDIKHNLRLKKSLNQSKNDENIYMDSNGEIITTIQEKKQLLNQYYEDRELHNELHKMTNKRNLRETNSTYINGVFTFSEKIMEDLGTKYTQEELLKVGYEALKGISEQLGSEIRYITLHMDEKTPHFQYHLTNFDDKGNSIFYKNRTREKLSKLQDIGYDYFSQLGMSRGEKKTINTPNYQTTQQYHERLLHTTKEDILKEIKVLTDLRKNVKSLRELTAEERQELRKEYSLKIKEKKQSLKSFNDNLDKNLDTIIESSKGFKFIDEEKLKPKLKKYIKNMSLNEIELIDIQKKNDLIKNYSEQTKEHLKKIESLEEDNKDLNNKLLLSDPDAVNKLNTKIKEQETRIIELLEEKREIEIKYNSVKNENDNMILDIKDKTTKELEDKYKITNRSKVIENENNNNIDIKK